MNLYAEDSFFTLSVSGRIGLVILSVLLAALILWLAWRWSAGKHILARAAIGLGLFIGFEWLSPQIYYAYYLVIFDGLPVQWVIGWPPGPASLVRLLSFTENANLSFHSRGVLGWALVLVALFRPGSTL